MIPIIIIICEAGSFQRERNSLRNIKVSHNGYVPTALDNSKYQKLTAHDVNYDEQRYKIRKILLATNKNTS